MLVTGANAGFAITIDAVTVGNPGNADDFTGYGGVSYVYNIGVKEVNLFQYSTFLNAVAATDTYELYNTGMETDLNIVGISRSGSSGSYTYSVIGSGYRPVTYVSWFDAARFANWMANGQPIGAQESSTTEDGAYSLFGATSGVNFAKNATNPNTGMAATWWIPSQNEWYKAAYFDPTPNAGAGDNYWLWPTRSDTSPGNAIGVGTNQANCYAGDYSVTQSPIYSPGQNYLTEGGVFSNSASYYGTFDQGGDVWEWNDDVISLSRRLRGGAWNSPENYLHSSFADYSLPTGEGFDVGFRLASVPEPSTILLVLMGGAGCIGSGSVRRLRDARAKNNPCFCGTFGRHPDDSAARAGGMPKTSRD